MTNQEFDAYLDLLARFLDLDPGQREEIRRELRAHLEEALEHELAAGRSRDEALRRVLGEFGDAAELAARFRGPNRKRRWIMQGTMTAACVGVLAVTLCFHQGADVVRTSGGGQPPAAKAEAKTVVTTDEGIQRALQTVLPEVRFQEMPLEACVEWMAEAIGVNVHVQWAQLEWQGAAREQPVRLHVRNLTAARVLRLILDDLEDAAVDFDVLDGVVMVSTSDALSRRMTTEVYDVRDVLLMVAERPVPAVQAPPPMVTPGQGGSPPLPPAVTYEAVAEPADERLVSLLEATLSPDEWEVNGGAGAMRVANGILVVRQQHSVHNEIKKLLADLRALPSAPAR